MINLLLTFIFLKLVYHKQLRNRTLTKITDPVSDVKLASLCKVSLVIIVALIGLKITVVFFGLGADFRLTYIALAAAAPILVLSPKRLKIVRKI